MYTSDQLKALLESRTGGTDQNLTGYESYPPASPADIAANASITTIPGPQGQTQQIMPGQKLSGYIPVAPGLPQWGMPKETTNWNAAQYSTTDMQFNSPLALSVEQKYDLSAIPPVIYPKGVRNAQKEGFNVKNAEVNQGTARQSSGENVKAVPKEGQEVGPHEQNAFHWQ